MRPVLHQLYDKESKYHWLKMKELTGKLKQRKLTNLVKCKVKIMYQRQIISIDQINLPKGIKEM